VSPQARDMARRLMRDILAHHRKPNLSRINMVLDARAVTLSEAIDPDAFWTEEKQGWGKGQKKRAAKAKAQGKTPKLAEWMRTSRKREAPKPEREKPSVFPLWVKMPTMVAGETILVPLLAHDRFRAREGERRPTIQVNERDGRIFFGIITDIASACKQSREAYEPLIDEIALDFGLRTLFATDRGDLLGRGFLAKLREYDRRISALAAYRQKHGLKVRSPRYDREVERLRGFLRSEIGRVLNRLVAVQRPGRIIVEKLCFRSPHLSKRLNRLIGNCGRRIISKKLDDLSERFGIEIVAVNAAYSSQTCSLCEYVDKKNRTGEMFSCRWCGHVVHADVNAPRNLRTRRSRPAVGSVTQTKRAVLRTLVREFPRRCAERSEGRRGTSRDPRAENPYFSDLSHAVISSGVVHEVAITSCATAP
jgi:putative transposase